MNDNPLISKYAAGRQRKQWIDAYQPSKIKAIKRRRRLREANWSFAGKGVEKALKAVQDATAD